MIAIKRLRERPEYIRQALNKKKFPCDLDAFLALDQRRREAMQEAEQARAQQKSLSEQIASLTKGSAAFTEKVNRMRTLAAHVKALEAKLKPIETEWKQQLLCIPNLPHDTVPDGKGESDNQIVGQWGDPDKASAYAKAHYELPQLARWLDFARGAAVTGAGFAFYIGPMARLVRALIQFFLEEARQAGYIEIAPPLFVNTASATATGQLPDKEGQMYSIGDTLYAIPTAEVPVTNFLSDSIVSIKELPICYVAYSPCFRREAGSWGKEVRGLNRLHQFDKVELVQWVRPDCSFERLERLRSEAESLLQKLNLPYRTLLMCTGELGFPHAKQYDLEVWAAGQRHWLEVSSCSNFTDFQARRAQTRYRDTEGTLHFVHTLNGSALAVPRVLAALLENNLQADGQIVIPEVLQPWYGDTVLRENVGTTD